MSKDNPIVNRFSNKISFSDHHHKFMIFSFCFLAKNKVRLPLSFFHCKSPLCFISSPLPEANLYTRHYPPLKTVHPTPHPHPLPNALKHPKHNSLSPTQTSDTVVSHKDEEINSSQSQILFF